MTKNAIVKELYETNFVDRYVRKLYTWNWENIDDIIQDIYVMVCELPDERLMDLYENGGINKVRQFITGIIHNQLKSCNSRLYYKYILGGLEGKKNYSLEGI